MLTGMREREREGEREGGNLRLRMGRQIRVEKKINLL